MSSVTDDAAELARRLARIKALCQRLVTEQANSAETRAVAERICAEVEAARVTLEGPKL
jgi:hypothetical protein